jgi:succinate dehydrogenase / fumarate reductase membrane anchor subunit
MATTTSRQAVVKPPRNYETVAWRAMRLSGVALIVLVWVHVLLQDILVGVHAIDLDYVAMRWASLGWRIFDAALLALAFAHGMNGVRQVAYDYITSPRARRILVIGLFLFWLAITAVGAIALIAGVNQQFPLEP